MKRLVPCSAFALLACAALSQAQEITPPSTHLGREVGVDFQLADWSEVGGYFKKLAKQSPRVLVETVGQTTEGREFLLATISSEENLKNLDQIRADAARIADPRGMTPAEREALLKRAKVILFVSCAMHSTETAAPQLGMELAHRLATSDAEPWATARENLVVLVAPTLNPDGLDEVVSWYRKTVDTPHEGSGLTRLYQLYAGHDNNRDWFGLTQNETRIVTRLLYSVWHPQVYWDVHQQGSRRERFFVPPFRDPLNPNLDPAIISGIDALGSRALHDMTREGLTGVSTGVTYDMWWNGGNRNVPVRHNIIGLLTEAASVNLASPVFLKREDLQAPRGLPAYAPSNRFPNPWPGGWWRLRDIIDYEMSFGRSLLGSLGREPRTWLGNSLEAAERAVAGGKDAAPQAWLIPSDNVNVGAVRRLVDTLLIGGVEVSVASAAFEADGRRWPAGSIVIPRDQPYGSHVKDLFEVQRYPEGDPPYDVAGWTLPLLFGVRRVEVIRPFEVETEAAKTPEAAVAGFTRARGPAAWDARDSDAWRMAISQLKAETPVHFYSQGERAGLLAAGQPDEDEAGRATLTPPRIGVYAPWRGSKDEGWLRWVLDTWEVPYTRVRNEMIRAGNLGDFLDVLIIPSVGEGSLDDGRPSGSVPEEFAGGLAPEGAVAIEAFVREGGTLVAMASSASWTVDLFDLPLEDVTDPDPPGKKTEKKKKKEEAPAFSCPGSIVRAVPEPTGITTGLDDSLAVFFSYAKAWRVLKPKKNDKEAVKPQPEIEILLRYAQTRVLLSGWIKGPEVIAGQAAWLRVRQGKGRIHLFGFRPQYRGWSEGTFPLLFRAVYLEGKL